MWPFKSKNKPEAKPAKETSPLETKFNDRAARLVAEYLATTPPKPTREEINILSRALLKSLKKPGNS